MADESLVLELVEMATDGDFGDLQFRGKCLDAHRPLPLQQVDNFSACGLEQLDVRRHCSSKYAVVWIWSTPSLLNSSE